MASQEVTVQEALSKFLTDHSLEGHVESIDQIVLQYVISILEDLGDDRNAEENIDVEQFVEMMEAYIPGFATIDSIAVCEWMFDLANFLSSSRFSTEKTISEVPNSPTLDSELMAGASALTITDTGLDLGSAGESERSTSESSDEVDEQVHLLMEAFPAALRVEVEHCLSAAAGNMELAAQLILHRQETGDSITSPRKSTEKHRRRTQKSLETDKEMKDLVVSRYAYIDEQVDKKTHSPAPPKAEPKKMVRYLDGRVVNTKGNKFTEIKKDDSEEMKKTYISLKPARKYRFH